MKRHLFILALLIGVISAALVVVFLRFQLTPAAASSQAQTIDNLLSLLFSIGAVIFAICLVFLVYSAVVFRRRPGDTEDGPPVQGHAPLELIWTLIPLAIVISLGTYGGITLRSISKPPAEGKELEVRITAFQWAWLFYYPEYGITSPELRLPVDKPVLFKLTSRDVVHSFWVPEFRVKMDAVPGRENMLRVTPTREGDYMAWCAEMCGLGHALMKAPVKVVSEAEFQRWVEERRSR